MTSCKLPAVTTNISHKLTKGVWYYIDRNISHTDLAFACKPTWTLIMTLVTNIIEKSKLDKESSKSAVIDADSLNRQNSSVKSVSFCSTKVNTNNKHPGMQIPTFDTLKTKLESQKLDRRFHIVLEIISLVAIFLAPSNLSFIAYTFLLILDAIVYIQRKTIFYDLYFTPISLIVVVSFHLLDRTLELANSTALALLLLVPNTIWEVFSDLSQPFYIFYMLVTVFFIAGITLIASLLNSIQDMYGNNSLGSDYYLDVCIFAGKAFVYLNLIKEHSLEISGVYQYMNVYHKYYKSKGKRNKIEAS